ncbi:hypothetical protein GRF61_16545 [Azoarcus sp. TTM-91]|uniref:hypothetical protein n=1 Tax=Azoarcus sp. TTM-91 TaxID=2691581 RepID=UPI00145D5D91|nr:hypothetical protein [Azoarcus sp. TTM-91]NMG36058.1 hypothetical protein [Azoarcus sp. TTM-91]
MKIDTSYDSTTFKTYSSAAAGGDSQASFQAALSKARQVGGGSDSASTETPAKTVMTAQDKAEIQRAREEKVLADFRDYMEKTPAERMRDAILRDMGLTEEDLAAMPAEERAAVEDEIAERIKDKLLAQGVEADGSAAPPTAELRYVLPTQSASAAGDNSRSLPGN